MSSHLKTLYKQVVGAIGAHAVDALIARAQRNPYDHLAGYMERYWLFQAPAWPKLPRWVPRLPSVRLHRILRSDADRHMHTHPWWNVSLVLRGTYWEVMPAPVGAEGSHIGGYAALDEPFFINQRKPGHIVLRSRHARHKLMLFRGPVWTLFIHGHDAGWGWGYLIDRNSYRDWRAQP